ncbi:MAG: hypothetical protein ABIP74_00025 [Candidatus Saccharimonas sp.]
MNNQKIYFSVLGLVLVGFCVNVFLIMNSTWSVPHAATLPSDAKFAATASLEVDTSDQALPKVYNLPLAISRSQTLRLQRFLYQFARDNNFTPSLSGQYREGSLYHTSSGASLLIDIAAAKQTLSVKTMLDDTLGISCGSRIDQKEASWTCLDDLLGESE